MFPSGPPNVFTHIASLSRIRSCHQKTPKRPTGAQRQYCLQSSAFTGTKPTASSINVKCTGSPNQMVGWLVDWTALSTQCRSYRAFKVRLEILTFNQMMNEWMFIWCMLQVYSQKMSKCYGEQNTTANIKHHTTVHTAETLSVNIHINCSLTAISMWAGAGWIRCDPEQFLVSFLTPSTGISYWTSSLIH